MKKRGIPEGYYESVVVDYKIISTNGPDGDFPDDEKPCILLTVALGLDVPGQSVLLLARPCGSRTAVTRRTRSTTRTSTSVRRGAGTTGGARSRSTRRSS